MQVDTVPAAASRRFLPVGWWIVVLYLGYPLWWALGVNALMWTATTLVLFSALVLRGRLRVPRGFWVWGLFLAWLVLSSTQLDTPDRWLAFSYRASAYLSATMLFLYVFNVPRSELPSRRVVTVLAGFWMLVVVGGYLAMMFPGVAWHSFFERFLPDRLLDNVFVRSLVQPGFADASEFLGFSQPRPAAPFTWANEWGANLALLTPLMIATWVRSRSRLWNGFTRFMLVAAVVPIIASLNRGMWLSIAVGLLYGAIRLALAGNVRALTSTLIVMTLAGLLIFFTPLGEVGSKRLETPHSNKARAALYEEARDRALERPITGYGAPRPSEKNPNLPSVGTHGQIWLVLVSQGIIGGLLYLAWYLTLLMRSRRGTPGFGIWLHVVMLIAVVQLPYYEHLPMQLQTVMLTAAVIFRERMAGAQQDAAGPTVVRALPESDFVTVPARV